MVALLSHPTPSGERASVETHVNESTSRAAVMVLLLLGAFQNVLVGNKASFQSLMLSTLTLATARSTRQHMYL